MLNPAVLPDGLEHPQYLAITLKMLEQADVIYLLEGWGSSVGTTAEVEHARKLGLAVVSQAWESLCRPPQLKAGTSECLQRSGVVCTYSDEPHGWRLVPEVPTPAMLEVFAGGKTNTAFAQRQWQTMLNAAPRPHAGRVAEIDLVWHEINPVMTRTAEIHFVI
ncbi:DUF4406 domain-containing protein [Enterobacter asburiae]